MPVARQTLRNQRIPYRGRSHGREPQPPRGSKAVHKSGNIDEHLEQILVVHSLWGCRAATRRASATR